MDTVKFLVAEEVTKKWTHSKIITYTSEHGTLTLAVPAEFIWFATSQDPKYANSPTFEVEIPCLQYGTWISFRSGELTAAARLYLDENTKGELDSCSEDESSCEEPLHYIEFMISVKIGCGVMVQVSRCSSSMMDVVEYREMRNTLNIGTDLTISTRYFNDILYTTLSDSSGNYFEVVDNRELTNDTKNLIEYNAFVFDNQKLLSFEEAMKIMNEGYLDFLFGRG